MTASEPFWLFQLFGRFHPLIVHFPIALICVAFLMEVMAWRKRDHLLRPGISILLNTGMFSALLAVIFGWLLASHEEAEGTTLTIHRWVGVATFILSAVTVFFFRMGAQRVYRIFLVVSVGAVGVAGHYGAMLTHGEDYIRSTLRLSPTETRLSSAGVTGLRLANLSDTLSQQQIEDLNVEVRSILAHNCYNCHGEAKKRGGLRLDSKEALFAGGDSGASILPGNPAKSELIRRISLPAGHKEVMPSKGRLLSSDEIEILKFWVSKGAPWPEGKERSIYRIAPLAPRLPPLPPSADPAYNLPIDRFVNAYFRDKRIAWPRIVDDRTYLRRVYLDVIGLLPSPSETHAFLNDKRPDKREQLVKTLLTRGDDYAQHWLTFWNDLLRNDYSGTGYITGGRSDITQWLYASLYDNKPYNWFVKELISPTSESAGFIKGIKWRGTINSSQRTEMQAAQNVAQVFLGLNLKCASCHDSFISDWKLEDAYRFASVFADSTLEIHRCDIPTGKVAHAGSLFPELGELSVDAPTAQRLRELADFLTQPADGRLYRTLVNRLWAQLMGRGIIEPVDMMDNLPWSEDLLDWLAYDFVESGYDIRRLLFQILTSKTYQLQSVAITDPAELVAENYQFTGMIRRRLSAEQFADAVSQVFHPVYPDSLIAQKRLPSDITSRIPFARASLVANDPFQTALGRPNRETVTTSRLSQANLLQALELTNGDTFYKTLTRGAFEWKKKSYDTRRLVEALYNSAYGRAPTEEEFALTEELLGKTPGEKEIQDLVWAVTLSPEFQLIY